MATAIIRMAAMVPAVVSATKLSFSVFVDEVEIEVRGGKGGDGCVSFFRAKYVPKGGPDGGDGGKGGDVIFYADPGLNTLSDFKGRRNWYADNGEPGQGSQKYGKAAGDMTIKVPPGTLVFELGSNELLHDMQPDERWVVARGGRGGFGNERFKSSTNQTPRKATPGDPGEQHELRLELKLIADIGLVGLPNAGKSTLLRSVTRAEPKVAGYPFTTLSPQLGIAELDPSRRLVLADIPGLIEGAAGGAGLGHEFLRHIERTRVLLHMIDAAPLDGSDPIDSYRTIRGELAGYAPALSEKPEVVALNKADLLPEGEAQHLGERFRAELQLGSDTPVHVISGGTGRGLNELLEELWTTTNSSQRSTGWHS